MWFYVDWMFTCYFVFVCVSYFRLYVFVFCVSVSLFSVRVVGLFAYWLDWIWYLIVLFLYLCMFPLVCVCFVLGFIVLICGYLSFDIACVFDLTAVWVVWLDVHWVVVGLIVLFLYVTHCVTLYCLLKFVVRVCGWWFLLLMVVMVLCVLWLFASRFDLLRDGLVFWIYWWLFVLNCYWCWRF